MDDQIETPDDLAKNKPKNVDEVEWKQFTDRVTVDKLFFELTF